MVILFLTTEMFRLSELDKALEVTQSPYQHFRATSNENEWLAQG